MYICLYLLSLSLPLSLSLSLSLCLFLSLSLSIYIYGRCDLIMVVSTGRAQKKTCLAITQNYQNMHTHDGIFNAISNKVLYCKGTAAIASQNCWTLKF